MPRSHRRSLPISALAVVAAALAIAYLPVSSASPETESDSVHSSTSRTASSTLEQIGLKVSQTTEPPPPAATRAASGVLPPVSPEVPNSNLDAQLFYQLLIGEIELRTGEVGTAYQVLLDAARRTRDEALFRRVTDLALQARAGEQALAAARGWRTSIPDSLDAHRYIVQLLVALNRPAETVEPLRSLIALTPVIERPQLISSLPRFFGRQGIQAQSLTALEQTLQPYMDAPETRAAARVALARGALASGDSSRALTLASLAHHQDPDAQAPAILALELMREQPQAESILVDYFSRKPQNESKTGNAIRMVYVRVLTAAQRYPDAIAQLEAVTRSDPSQASAWLGLGALQLDLRQPAEAEAALNTFVKLTEAQPAMPGPAAAPAASASSGAPGIAADAEDEDGSKEERLTQAYMLLAQAAEQRGDLPMAERWLKKIDNAQTALDVQLRRASLLRRQGKLDEARELIRRSPERTPQDGRAKLLAEAQLLRDGKNWSEAAKVLATANERYADDADIIYEQSMMAEKLGQMDEMERMLRRVIELKPSHHHAYNALGYSLAERGVRLPEARDLIRKALDLVPGEPFITDSLGWVEYRMGNKEEALKHLRQAYRSRPDTEIGAHLGEVLWVSGDKDEARKVWSEARRRDAENDVLRETLARLRVDL